MCTRGATIDDYRDVSRSPSLEYSCETNFNACRSVLITSIPAALFLLVQLALSSPGDLIYIRGKREWLCKVQSVHAAWQVHRSQSAWLPTGTGRCLGDRCQAEPASGLDPAARPVAWLT